MGAGAIVKIGRAVAQALLVAAMTLAATGCGDERPPGSAGPAPASSPETVPTETPAAGNPPAGSGPRSHTIRFRASDGTPLRGRYTAANRRNAPGVVLVHEYRGGPRQWDPLVPVLHRAGYATLAYASRSADEIDETVLVKDVIGAVHALRRRRGVDRRRIALIGASIGGTAITRALGLHARLDLRAGIGLSAASSTDLIDGGAGGRFKPHDLLLIADKSEIVDAQNIRDDAGGRGVTTWTAPTGGHGVALLSDARVRERMLAWLDAAMRRRR